MDGAKPPDSDRSSRSHIRLRLARGARALPVFRRPEVSCSCSYRSGIDLSIRKAVRMGSHVWLLLATVVTELVVIRKWSANQFDEPFPKHVKLGLAFGTVALFVYPMLKASNFSHFSCSGGRSDLNSAIVWGPKYSEVRAETAQSGPWKDKLTE